MDTNQDTQIKRNKFFPILSIIIGILFIFSAVKFLGTGEIGQGFFNIVIGGAFLSLGFFSIRKSSSLAARYGKKFSRVVLVIFAIILIGAVGPFILLFLGSLFSS
jgi:hypothetical protein